MTEDLVRLATGAEAAGLDSVWVMDRWLRPRRGVMMPGVPVPVELPAEGYACVFDPLDVLAHLAALTTRCGSARARCRRSYSRRCCWPGGSRPSTSSPAAGSWPGSPPGGCRRSSPPRGCPRRAPAPGSRSISPRCAPCGVPTPSRSRASVRCRPRTWARSRSAARPSRFCSDTAPRPGSAARRASPTGCTRTAPTSTSWPPTSPSSGRRGDGRRAGPRRAAGRAARRRRARPDAGPGRPLFRGTRRPVGGGRGAGGRARGRPPRPAGRRAPSRPALDALPRLRGLVTA